MAEQYIFTIENLSKAYGKREVLKNIWLAFYPGAKIGVLGRNGSGKSTLLRIMAGKDKNFDGEARLTEGYTVGLLEQEPQLNPDKDVFGNVEEAVAPNRALLTEFEKLSEKLGEVSDPDEMEKLLERQAKVQDRIDAVNAWELDSDGVWTRVPPAKSGKTHSHHATMMRRARTRARRRSRARRAG